MRFSSVMPSSCHIALVLLCVSASAGPLSAQDRPPGAAPAAEQQSGTATDQASDPSEPIPSRLFFDVTVTAASRTVEQTGRVPQAVTVATLQSIERRQPRTANQMLSEEPGVWSVQVSAQGSPIIRGLIGNRVLYLWDGIRLNNGALFSGPNGFFNQFPVGGVEQMEVVRGPGAVQYGSDAIGGVINVVQRSANLFTSAVQTGGDASVRFGSVDDEKTSYGNFWLTSGRVALSAGLTGQDIGNYRVPGGDRMKNTGISTGGGYLDLALKVNDRDRVKVSWVHNRRFDIGTYTQSKLNASGIPRIVGPFEQRGIVRADYIVERPSAALSQIRVYAYDQYYTSARDTTVETATLLNRTRVDTDQQMVGVGTQATMSHGRTRLIYGGDLRTEDLSANRTLFATTKSSGIVASSVPNGNVPPGTYSVADAFVLAQVAVSSRLSWSLGGRAETSKLHSEPRPEDALTPFTVTDLAIDRRWSAATWSMGTVYRVAGNWSVAGNIATGFRAPTFSDTLSTGVPVFASGVASIPSTGVDPEHSITYEIGPRYQSPRVNFTLTAYTNQMTDLLTSRPAGTIAIPGVGVVQALQNSNVASAHVRGLESAVAYRVTSQLTAQAHFTVTRGQDTFANAPLRFIPPANGLVGVLWERPARGLWLEANARFADRLRRHAPQDELDAGFSTDPGFGSPSATNPPLPGFQIPGWTMVTVRGGVMLWEAKNDRRRIEATIDVNNLFDEQYREAYSQQQLFAPSVGAVAGLRVRF
jgi:hemoglobin/transferrin/lactoferrin receptor protein